VSTSGPVLLTGASGFLGSHLVHRLLDEGREVHALARPESRFTRLADVSSRITRWSGDITDADAVAHACRESRAELVFHCAGDTSSRTFAGDWSAVDRAMRVNLHGTLAMLHGASQPGSRVATLVRIGGLEEYGTAPTPWTESMREAPSSPYSASQVAATHACQALQPQLPFAVVTLRPALIYGPGQSTDFLIPALITALLRGERFALTDGRQHRDLLYVDDFVAAALRAGAHDNLRGAVINIASGQEWEVVTVVRRIAKLLDATSLLDIGARPPRAGELQHLVARNELAAELLDWRPTVALDEGLRRTVAWYRGTSQDGARR
jgi:nucleoside-diphosphate-sugar epimerase